MFNGKHILVKEKNPYENKFHRDLKINYYSLNLLKLKS